MSCKFDQCQGLMVCGNCTLTSCDCDTTYHQCNRCGHKLCHWCGNSTLDNEDCEECAHWDCVGDVCELDFCIHYLNGKGSITKTLTCNECYSVLPLIRVPLAFPLHLDQLLKDYPKFENIKGCFLKYYSYSHLTGIWEPYSHSEFRLAQEYFDFDGGVIVLGRSKDDENKAKNKEMLKAEKEFCKMEKKKRRLQKLEERNGKVNNILSI